MSTQPDFERLLERVDASRRDAVRKLLVGAALYTAPLIASYSMDSLEGVANAQVPNQTPAAIPATSGWSLVALAGALSAAAAFALRRRRGK
ncbi:MAG TPA: IPTL-CTERM sorting domain-containing protein [Casimicrobiaceae bacterium]|nr:IPTL-CTERM sorting domain-containing protein [Casimicrobiaceae bacterium]